MASPIHPLASELAARAEGLGFNLVGFASAAHFDATQPAGRRSTDLQPACGTVFLLGSGGRGFWRRLLESGVVPGAPAPDHHPIDGYCAGAGEQLVAWLRSRGVTAGITQPDDRPSLNFTQLAEMAGWGTVSPVVGLLLHPDFGPWVSIRLALLIDGTPFGEVQPEEHLPFQPCSRCDRPCVRACPAGVYDGLGAVHLEACAHRRQAGDCAGGCEARRACPVGADQRYGPTEEGFRHAYSLFAMRRHYGLG